MKNSQINRFLNRELPKEELKELQADLNQQEEAFIDFLENDWNSFNDSEEPPAHVWNRLEEQIRPADRKRLRTKEFRPSWYIKVAASLAVIASVWFALRPANEPQTVDSDTPAMISHVNDHTTPETVILKDGTKVLLGPNSTLSYYESFNDRYRVVHLEGEAWFETNKVNERPFIVVSQNITSICRSHEFSVTAFKNSDEISVVSSSGNIEIAQNDRLNSEANKIAVQSCQKYSFNKASQQYLIGKIADCEYDGKVRSMKEQAGEEVIVML